MEPKISHLDTDGDQQDLHQRMVNRRLKNLEFFQSISPELHNKLEIKPSQEFTLWARPEDKNGHKRDVYDLIDKRGAHLYGGDVEQYTLAECRRFRSGLMPGTRLKTLRPPLASDYSYPRFFHQAIQDHLHHSPIQSTEDWQGYLISERYPHLVIMGLGVGFVLRNLLKEQCLSRVTLFDVSMDQLKWSLYTIDWLALYQEACHQGVEIGFTLGDDDKESRMLSMLWSKLKIMHPLYPINNFFYVHGNHPCFTGMVEKISNKLINYLYTRGNYDDEVNQLNQVLHNVHRGCRLLRKPEDLFGGHFRHQEIIIVGSGPSLDQYTATLVGRRSDALLVSCGSSITALYQLGMKPDIHVEAESDYRFTTAYLELIDDKSYLDDIVLLGPIQLIPKLSDYFSIRYFCFRAEGRANSLFDADGLWETSSVSSCVVLAIQLFLQLKPKRVSLFGVDCAFQDIELHHSRHSLYYNDTAGEDLQEYSAYQDRELMEIEGVHGEKVLTEPYLYNNLRFIEWSITRYGTGIDIDNYSSGAKINGTVWKKLFDKADTDSAAHLDRLEIDTHETNAPSREWLKSIFDRYSDQLAIDPEVLDLEAVRMECSYTGISQTIKECKEQGAGILECSQQIGDQIQHALQIRGSIVEVLLQATLWHFSHAGYTHEQSILRDGDRAAYREQWLLDFERFLKSICSHFKEIMFRYQMGDGDLWLHKSIMDAE